MPDDFVFEIPLSVMDKKKTLCTKVASAIRKVRLFSYKFVFLVESSTLGPETVRAYQENQVSLRELIKIYCRGDRETLAFRTSVCLQR